MNNNLKEMTFFNYGEIEPYLNNKGTNLYFEEGDTIVNRGSSPNYIFFIKKGRVLGQRDYSDGNEFNYFQIDEKNGSIGLLEVLSRKEKYVATITCLSDVEIIRVPSDIVYRTIMNNSELLQMVVYLLADDLYKRSANDGLYYYYSGIDRLRLWLVNFYYSNNGEDYLTVDISYEEIGHQIGVSTRTVGRSVKILKETEELSVRNKKIVLSKDSISEINNYLLNIG